MDLWLTVRISTSGIKVLSSALWRSGSSIGTSYRRWKLTVVKEIVKFQMWVWLNPTSSINDPYTYFMFFFCGDVASFSLVIVEHLDSLSLSHIRTPQHGKLLECIISDKDMGRLDLEWYRRRENYWTYLIIYVHTIIDFETHSVNQIYIKNKK